MNPLPPQAYTKETLLKAYSWLQNQNDHIKELATTPDILISLYIKAKMNGHAALEAPSIQNFKTELKNLAGMIGEFEGQKEAPVQTMQAPVQSTIQTPPQTLQSPVQLPPAQPYAANLTGMSAAQGNLELDNRLDFRSLTMLREIKNEFNLSSDQEALRLLISVGHKKLKSLS